MQDNHDILTSIDIGEPQSPKKPIGLPFSAQLREARIAQNLTQAQVAALVGVSQGTIAKLEAKYKDQPLFLTPQIIVAWADVLGFTLCVIPKEKQKC